MALVALLSILPSSDEESYHACGSVLRGGRLPRPKEDHHNSRKRVITIWWCGWTRFSREGTSNGENADEHFGQVVVPGKLHKPDQGWEQTLKDAVVLLVLVQFCVLLDRKLPLLRSGGTYLFLA